MTKFVLIEVRTPVRHQIKKSGLRDMFYQHKFLSWLKMYSIFFNELTSSESSVFLPLKHKALLVVCSNIYNITLIFYSLN